MKQGFQWFLEKGFSMKKLEFEESEYWDMVVQRNELLFALTFYAEGRHLINRRFKNPRQDPDQVVLKYIFKKRLIVEDGKLARSMIARVKAAGVCVR